MQSLSGQMVLLGLGLLYSKLKQGLLRGCFYTCCNHSVELTPWTGRQDCTTRTTSLATGSIQPCSVHYSLGLWLCSLQAAALAEAAAVHKELLRCESEAAAQLAAESARRAQAEEAVEQYIAAHYASQAAAQVASPVVT